MTDTTTLPRETVSPEDLAALNAVLARVQRDLAEATVLAGRLAGSGVAESVEGLELSHYLTLSARLPGAHAARLVATGEILADLPTLAGLLEAGEVSYQLVEVICQQVRSLGREQRLAVDGRIGATIVERGSLASFAPDDLVEAVAGAVDDCRRARSMEQREDRRERGAFCAVQPRMDGSGGTGFFDLGPLGFDIVTSGMFAAAKDAERAGDTPERIPTGDPDDDDQPAEENPRRRPHSRGQRLALGLRRMAATYLGGDVDGGGRRPARPLVEVVVQLHGIEARAAGLVLANHRGDLPRLCARTVDTLARDADLRVAVFDGAHPLALSAKRRAPRSAPPAKVVAAVRVRDRGDRFPGSRLPLGACDIDHLRPRSAGGLHDPANLAAINRHVNRNRARTGWQFRLVKATGELIATRRHREWRSLPRGTPLSRPNDGGDQSGDRLGEHPGDHAGGPGRPAPPDDPTLPF